MKTNEQILAEFCVYPPAAYIIEDEQGNWIGECDYCYECALKRKRETDFLSGGGGGSESDNPKWCADCDKLLDYVLTDSGADNEIVHYRRKRLKPLSRETAFHIERIVVARPDDKEAQRLAARAVKAIVR